MYCLVILAGGSAVVGSLGHRRLSVSAGDGERVRPLTRNSESYLFSEMGN